MTSLFNLWRRWRRRRLSDAALTWLARLNNPAITDREVADFQSWLMADPAHAEAYVLAESVWQQGERLAAARPDQSLSPARRMPFGRWPFDLSPLQWTLALPAVAVVFGLFILLRQPGSVTEAVYQTALGDITAVTLADASRIHLNTGTQLRVRFSGTERHVVLESGEALFEVQKDLKRPFVVETASGRIRVLGTVFSVQVSAHDAEITVSEGRVALHPAGTANNDTAPAAVLIRNQRADMTSSGLSAIEHLDAERALSWQKSQLIFDQTPLHQVIADINRYRAEPLTLAPELALLPVTAVLAVGKQSQDPAVALTQVLGLTLEQNRIMPASF